MDFANWTTASLLTFQSPSTPILYRVKDEAKSDVVSLRAWTKHRQTMSKTKKNLTSHENEGEEVFADASCFFSVLCSLQAMHCRQRTFKFGFIPCGY